MAYVPPRRNSSGTFVIRSLSDMPPPGVPATLGRNGGVVVPVGAGQVVVGSRVPGAAGAVPSLGRNGGVTGEVGAGPGMAGRETGGVVAVGGTIVPGAIPGV